MPIPGGGAPGNKSITDALRSLIIAILMEDKVKDKSKDKSKDKVKKS